ncbi:MAG: hypothetical protein HY447_03330 [Candidatus Omnitrophica bacterium]|nr:hypothetical protein [Candidatus Omnitrophota bacterium]
MSKKLVGFIVVTVVLSLAASTAYACPCSLKKGNQVDKLAQTTESPETNLSASAVTV